MTLWTKEAKEELRLQAIASTERQIEQLQDFIETLDIQNNETHRTVILTLLPSIYEMQRNVLTMKEENK